MGGVLSISKWKNVNISHFKFLLKFVFVHYIFFSGKSKLNINEEVMTLLPLIDFNSTSYMSVFANICVESDGHSNLDQTKHMLINSIVCSFIST